MTEDERREELERQRRALKKTKGIPYDKLKRAKAHFEEKFPKADCVQALYSFGQVYVEVWKDRHAKIWFYEEA